jgi:transposase InsO family protein
MDGPPFIVSAQVNRECFSKSLIDTGCQTYGIIDSHFVQRHGITRVSIPPRKFQGFENNLMITINEVAKLTLDIGGCCQHNMFLYIAPKLSGYDIILGLPWLQQQRANIILSGPEPKLVFEDTGIEVLSEYGGTSRGPPPKHISAVAFNWLTSHRKRKKGTEVFTASMADIEKALKVRKHTDPKVKLPAHYHTYLDVFDRQAADVLPPFRPGVDHRIELEATDGKKPELPWGPLYNMSREELLVLRKTLTELLDKGFIRVSNSPAAAPILFAKKPGGGLRFCQDYRALNKITKKDRYPLPLVNETLERVGKAQWFTKLDVIAAFNKIRIAEGDEWLTAFRTRYGLFEWLVTPFGLANAPSTFQRYINWTLRDFLDEFASAYLDDILIFSNSLKEHRGHVSKVLQRLRDAGLQLDIDKCEFEVKTTKYLGFIVEAGKGIRMDPEKVQAIIEWEAPKSVKGVRAFLGFANFYRRFIKNFSEIVTPMTALTRKDAMFKWTDETNNAFESLKQMFISAPILMMFDPDKETVVEADSSGYATGGLLLQYDDFGVLRPCAYFSKRNTPAECNYGIFDKELLAIIRCLKEWESELLSVKKFRIITDHKNLEYFTTTRRLTERQMRWADILSRFNFTITYRPGKDGTLPDALSRREQDMPNRADDERLRHREMLLLRPETFENGTTTLAPVRTRSQAGQHQNPSESLTQDNVRPQISDTPEDDGSNSALEDEHDNELQDEPGSTTEPGIPRTLEEQWGQALAHDNVLQELTLAVREGQRKFPSNLGVKVSISECTLNERGELLFRSRLWVPKSEPLRTRIIQETHDSVMTGHPGRETTLALLSRRFFWPTCATDVRRFVRNCGKCGANTLWRSRRQGLLKPLPIPDRRWREISIDFIQNLHEAQGYRHLLVITDRLSKEVIIEPVKNMDVDTVVEVFFKEVYRHHGLPGAIVSDRGKAFVNRFWKRICQLLGITRRLSTAYHPETDGSTERANQVIEAYFRMFVNYAQDDWPKWSFLAQLAINNRDATSTGVSPFFFSHGYHLNPLDFTEEPEYREGSNPVRAAERMAYKLREVTEWAQTAMAAAQQTQEDYANRGRDAAMHYKVGDKVWLDLRNIKTDRPMKKFDACHAKFTVTERIGSHAYRLNTPPGIDNVFHTHLLRPAHDDPFPSQIQTDWQPPAIVTESDDNGDEEYAVERILQERIKKVGRGQRREFLVKWVGYARATWEPASAFEDTVALDRYEKTQQALASEREEGIM